MRLMIRTLKFGVRKRFVRLLDKNMKVLNLISRWIAGPVVLYSVHNPYADNNHHRSQNNSSTNLGVAILLQGPVDQNPKATLRTVSLYRAQWPNIPVVVSTWVKSDKNILASLQNLGAHIQLNEIPAYNGISNSNYQIVSTMGGLQYIKGLGLNLTLKSRVDQCLFNSRSIFLLKQMLQEYGDRIVTTDFNSFLFRLFSPNDQLMFSRTEILEEFWSAAAQQGNKLEAVPGPVESKFLISFLQSKGMLVQQDLISSLSVYRDHYAFINYEDLDLVWNKGSFRNLRSRFPQENYPSNISFVRNLDWLNLQKSLDPYLQDFKSIRD
jgi:hypothetical protein